MAYVLHPLFKGRVVETNNTNRDFEYEKHYSEFDTLIESLENDPESANQLSQAREWISESFYNDDTLPDNTYKLQQYLCGTPNPDLWEYYNDSVNHDIKYSLIKYGLISTELQFIKFDFDSFVLGHLRDIASKNNNFLVIKMKTHNEMCDEMFSEVHIPETNLFDDLKSLTEKELNDNEYIQAYYNAYIDMHLLSQFYNLIDDMKISKLERNDMLDSELAEWDLERLREIAKHCNLFLSIKFVTREEMLNEINS
jgi:hypothetical protein